MPSQTITPSNPSLKYTLEVRFVEEAPQHKDLYMEIVACIEQGTVLELSAAQLQQESEVKNSAIEGFDKSSIIQSLTRYEKENDTATESDDDE